MDLRKLTLSLLFFLFFGINVRSSTESVRKDFFSKAYLGEQYSKDMYSPLDLELNNPSRDLINVSKDEKFYRDFSLGNIVHEIEMLFHFWQQDLQQNKFCPDELMAEHYSYIRYLYRLINISYLYEALIDLNKASFEFDQNGSSCSLSWDEVFKNCRPKSVDMKKFLSRAQNSYLNLIDYSKYSRIKRSSYDKEVTQIKDLVTSGSYARPNLFYLEEYCELENCTDLNVKVITKVIENSCVENKKLIRKICSEDDQFYGVSEIKEATVLLSRSNVMSVISDTNSGAFCLEKFIKLNKKRELSFERMERLYKVIMTHLLKKGTPYLQGGLFVLGALREFDDLGVGDLVFDTMTKDRELKVPTLEKFVKVAPKEIKQRIVPKVLKKIEKRIQRKKKKKEKKISQFELAVKEFHSSSDAKVAVNMELMKEDYLFDDKLLLILTKSLGVYQTRKALREMKKYDHLGSSKEPVRLLFLKYLIDYNYHQGLFNIQSTLGKRFFVINDIDKKKDGQLIELENNLKTNLRWQIYIVRNLN